jgi:hypothetical protein
MDAMPVSADCGAAEDLVRPRHSEFCNRRKAIAIRIHIENAKNNRGLFLIEFQLHTTHCCTTVLAHPGLIFDRNIAVAETSPTGLHSLQRPSS